MGTWGTGIYDNDMALDFKSILIDLAFEKAELNEDFLVIADMVRNKDYTLSIYQSAKLVEVINQELRSLEYWKENKRDERKKVLLDLLQGMNTVYISKDKQSLIYPYKVDGKYCKTQMHHCTGGVLCDWDCVDVLNENYEILVDVKFTIGESGLDVSEVEDYFKHLISDGEVAIRRLVEANQDLTNEFGNYIIKKGKEYTLLEMSNGTYTIVDEMQTTCVVDSEYFSCITELIL